MAEPTGLDLSSILAAAATYRGQVVRETKALQANAEAQSGFTGQNADLYNTIGQSAVIIDGVKQGAELVTQQAKIKNANELGTNLKVQSDYRDNLTNLILQEGTRYDQQLKAVEEKSSVSFFDDPLQWIMNQVTIDDDKAAAEATGKRLNAAKQQMLDLNTITQSQNTTANQLTESVTAASIAANAAKISAEAAINANKEKIQGLAYNAEGIKAALNADKELLQTSFSVFGAQKQEQQINIALAHLALSREEFDWKKQDKAKQEAGDQYIIDKINKGGQLRMGEAYVPIPQGSPKAAQIISLLKSNSPVGKQYQEDYLIGDQSELAGTRMLAPSPARAVEVLNTMPVKLAPAQSAVKSVLDQALVDTQKVAQTGQLDLKNKAAVDAFINKRAQEILDNQSKQVKPGDSENVFQIPPLRALLANSPTLAALPITKQVLLPAVTAGADLNDPNQVFGLVAKALQGKKITYPQALELATVYHIGSATNLEARQLPSLGLVPRFSYNAKITTNTAVPFGGNDIVDLTKADMIGRALNKYLASEVFQGTLDSVNPFVIGANAPKQFGGPIYSDPRQGNTNIYGR